jgi:hypothetical protein
MKYDSLKKIFIFLSCSILCFLIKASLSQAVQPSDDLSRQVFSAEALKTLEGFQGDEDVSPVNGPGAASKDKASVDIKVALSERFKAFLSLGDLTIRDMSGKDVGKSYDAVFGFQILLQ